ncbi:type II toxin-antitoxin system VapC family toxin [Aquibium sp. ELW1220]|uniref:type II toxin-antitoxin system VapC family toxin n=1 Tax=Aquibium sp. ELW1220 TaxID=2976766 RepID=UPI0025B00057|nr:type II toxin-antitoxin system VapC family toxin [Aquibium sp. ELW1220]MDN2580322.1 type II toxin-antitoxin system VapC family toxin [Aquibium sp. ELW1220]
MYVDASAMVAIITGEDDAEALVTRLAAADERISSVVSAFEAFLAMGTKLADRPAAAVVVREFLDLAGIGIATIGEDLFDGLADAHTRFGKGSGHPAQLNMGDCFSYAVAKAKGMSLLYKGNDFSRTDLA